MLRLKVAGTISIIFLFFSLHAQDDKISGSVDAKETIVYLQPNTTQLFTELYQAYGLLNPPKRTFIENALYLDQDTIGSIIPMQPSNQAIFDHASKVLTEYHKRVNDLELYVDPNKPKSFFYTAVGSKQIITALVYAIVTAEPDRKFVFAEQIPYYSGHPNAVSELFYYPNARFLPFHEPWEIKLEPGETLVEFVTSPNNPDGKFRRPVTDAEIIIADFVFASTAFGVEGTGYIEKNIDWIRRARAGGKHVFSFNSASKQFGKTGTRCGYIWYPLHDVYAASIFKSFFNFISYSTVAGGSAGLAEFLDLINAFLDLPDAGKALRKDGFQSLVKRHEAVKRELLLRYPGSVVTSIPGSPTLFARIKDKRIPSRKASDVIFEDVKVVVNPGTPMGESNEFVRLNLSGYSSLLVEFLNRLAGETKYKVEDMLTLSTDGCPVRKVVCNTPYFLSPADCNLDVDASRNSIEITLPPFIDYDKSEVITVRKMDSSDNPVVVKSADFARQLVKPGQELKIQWSQPFYQNGHWVAEPPDLQKIDTKATKPKKF